MRRACPSFLAALLCAVAARHAQPPGVLAGTVRTADGTPVPHLVLIVRGPDAARTVVTGPEGRYRVDGPRCPATIRARAATRPASCSRRRREPTSPTARPRSTSTLRRGPRARARAWWPPPATRPRSPPSASAPPSSIASASRSGERAVLLTLLQEVPGVTVARTGGLGLQGSLFVRGGDSNFARILVDGVPVNEPGGEYNLGPLLAPRARAHRGRARRGQQPLRHGRARRASSTSSRARGPAAARWRAEVEGGSFDWFRGASGHGPAGRPLRLERRAASHLRTDNEEPNSAFRADGRARRPLGFEASARTSLRLACAARTRSVGTPGQTAFGRPDLDASFERQIGVAGLPASTTCADARSHELRAGFALQDWLSRNPLDSGPYLPRAGDRVGTFTFFDFVDPARLPERHARGSPRATSSRRRSGGRHLVTRRGRARARDGGGRARAPSPSSIRSARTSAVTPRTAWSWAARLFLTLGGRVEHNASFGTRAVPRVAVAWTVGEARDHHAASASGGTGIKEPSFFESYGVSFYAMGNPDLEPERSVTFDAGLEQRPGRQPRAPGGHGLPSRLPRPDRLPDRGPRRRSRGPS